MSYGGKNNTKRGSHSPNLDTVAMVLDVICENKQIQSKNKLSRLLPKQVNNQTLKKILEYLALEKKIVVDDGGVIKFNEESTIADVGTEKNVVEFDEKKIKFLNSEIIWNIGYEEKTLSEITELCKHEKSFVQNSVELLCEQGCLNHHPKNGIEYYFLTDNGKNNFKLVKKINSYLDELTEKLGGNTR